MIGKFIDVALILVVLYGVFTFGKCRGYFVGYTDGQIQGYMVGYDSFYEKMYFFLRDSVDASKNKWNILSVAFGFFLVGWFFLFEV